MAVFVSVFSWCFLKRYPSFLFLNSGGRGRDSGGRKREEGGGGVNPTTGNETVAERARSFNHPCVWGR